MEPKINEKLKTFTSAYVFSLEMGSFLDTVLGRMKQLDNDHKLYLLAGLVERVYRIGVSDGIGKFFRVYIFSMIAMFLIGYLIGDAMYLFR